MEVTKKITAAPLALDAELRKRRLTNRKRGLDTAWPSANEFMSLKRGYPIMIGGVSGSGKTELAFDIVINSALMHKERWFVFSPETGDKYEIVENIIEKLAAGEVLSVGKNIENSLSDERYSQLLKWTNNYFRICDPSEHWEGNYRDLQLNMDNLFSAVDVEEKRLGAKFDGILIDTFNDLDIEPNSNVVKNELLRLLAWTKKKNYQCVVTNHANDTKEIRQKNNEGEWIIWTPPAKKEGWSYGQQFAKKGYQMLLVYQEPKFFVDDRAINGDHKASHAQQNYYNSRKIFVQKSKPKGVGKVGAFELFYDRAKQRYYDLDNVGVKKGILTL